MTERDESSTLIALSELWNLEADRVAEVESERRAREEAARAAREEIERKARSEAELRAREEAERLAKANAERERQEREARLRLQEAELRARAEQEARLRSEQMRLDAQIKITEKKARPLWLTITPIVLGLGLLAGGYAALDTIESRDQAAQAEREQAAKRDEEHRKVLAELTAQFGELKAEQDRLEDQRAELDAKLAEVKDENKRQLLLAEKTALDNKLDQNASRRRANRGKASSQRTATTAGPKRPGITISESDDPLAGLD
jgi:hypothetical protein